MTDISAIGPKELKLFPVGCNGLNKLSIQPLWMNSWQNCTATVYTTRSSSPQLDYSVRWAIPLTLYTL